jgi:hypothetical protein
MVSRSEDASVKPRRPLALDAGLFLLVVALPLAFFPLARHPFSDPKLVLLMVGTLLLWLCGTGIDRRLTPAAASWALASIVAAAAGVDPLGSLLGPWESTGLLLLLACAALVAVGPTLSAAAVERARGWLVWTALAVAGVAVLWRLAPELFGFFVEGLRFGGSTFGNPVFAAAFLGAVIPAVVAGRQRPWALVAVMIVLGSGFAVNGERSSLAIPFLAILACWWALPHHRARLRIAAVSLAATIGVWALLAPGLSLSDGGLRSAGGQFRTLEGERQRLAVWSANARAATRRPMLGWGPGLGSSAYVGSASASELEIAGRGWTDAHALPLQVVVTSGLLGLLAFGFLAWKVAPGLLWPLPGNSWTAASALTLAVFVLYEPLNLVVTPLLFLLAGCANSPRAEVRQVAPAGPRVVVAAALTAAVVLAGAGLTASALEQWGRMHYAEWAVRSSLALQPWRLSAAERLAIELALDGRAGNADAAAEARRLIEEAVTDHPWDPHVRLAAIDVELLLGNPEGVQRWRQDHLKHFPDDDLTLDVEKTERTVVSGWDPGSRPPLTAPVRAWVREHDDPGVSPARMIVATRGCTRCPA